MIHVIIGLFFIALGVWGVFDEWYYVVDFLKGGGSILLILAGALAIFAGAVGPHEESEESGELDDDPDDDLDDYELDDYELDDDPGELDDEPVAADDEDG